MSRDKKKHKQMPLVFDTTSRQWKRLNARGQTKNKNKKKPHLLRRLWLFFPSQWTKPLRSKSSIHLKKKKLPPTRTCCTLCVDTARTQRVVSVSHVAPSHREGRAFHFKSRTSSPPPSKKGGSSIPPYFVNRSSTVIGTGYHQKSKTTSCGWRSS